jgi:hypothetical protein
MIFDRLFRYRILASKNLLLIKNDKHVVKKLYRLSFKKKLNLDNPQTFNEKLQWLKLYDRNPEYTKMVDKAAAKDYVAERIGAEYIIPTLGVYEKFEDIDFNALPNQFVLKCTHDSGGLVICKDKSKLDVERAKRTINASLKANFYYHSREWPYKNVKPRIIAEKYIETQEKIGEQLNSLIVYKFMCFNGEPKVIQVIQGDKTQYESIDYFDAEWKLLDLRQNFPNSKVHLPKPRNFDKMFEFAKNFSAGRSFLRVDFYEPDQKLYFSEFTFYSDGGFAKFEPIEWDNELGEWMGLLKRR